MQKLLNLVRMYGLESEVVKVTRDIPNRMFITLVHDLSNEDVLMYDLLNPDVVNRYQGDYRKVM